MHHGFGQRGRSWTDEGWTGPLSERFTLVLLDAMGYGKSSRAGNLDSYLIPTRALALAALATHLGFVKFGVFGFSLGGRASLELGAIGDDRLGGMVVAGMKARMTADDVRGTPARVRALRSGRVKSLDPTVRGPEDNDAESLALSLEGVARYGPESGTASTVSKCPPCWSAGIRTRTTKARWRPRPPCRKASSSYCRA